MFQKEIIEVMINPVEQSHVFGKQNQEKRRHIDQQKTGNGFFSQEFQNKRSRIIAKATIFPE